MIKKSLAMASLLALGTSAMALDVQPFVGVGIEKTTLDYKGSVSVPGIGYSDSYSDDDSDTALKLKAGAILDKTHRLSVSHAKYSDNGADVRILLLNYDYLFPINEKFNLYTGAHAGQAKYEQDVNTDIGKIDIDMSGITYGLQVGALFDITKNIELEAGLAYSKYNVDDTISGTYLGVDYSLKTELEDSTSMFIGINYKF